MQKVRKHVNKSAIIWVGGLLALLWIYGASMNATAQSREGNNGEPVDFTLFLPLLANKSNSPQVNRPTPTLISTAPATLTPTLTPTATATPSPTNTSTATATTEPTPTVTATATATATDGPTPTATATSIPFPDVTFSCRAEAASGDALKLIIHAELSEAAPFGGASFRLDFTDQSGPIDDILQPLPFQLINFFSGDTAKDATGFLSKCDQADQCTATYTVTETKVTRYIGTSVDCTY